MPLMKVKQDGAWVDINGMFGQAHTHTIDDITNFPSSMPANGGDADTLDGKHASDFATAAYVDAKVDAIPAKVAEDGYTDITGLRRPISLTFVKSENTITATATWQGDKISTSVVTIGENGRPATVTTDGVECTVGWEGFDA